MLRNRGERDPCGAMGFLNDIRAFILCCVALLIVVALWSVQALIQQS
jgi:hypothetical protein